MKSSTSLLAEAFVGTLILGVVTQEILTSMTGNNEISNVIGTGLWLFSFFLVCL